ncbi:MAG: hypothetical protein WC783_02680 [Candidatus Paceibacterota bacterium]|jgi:hypothetical protein
MNPKELLIKKIKGINIWLVDGGMIRKELEPDFTNFGHSFRYKFVPKNEFWIDKSVLKNELPFFIYRLFLEYDLMGKGMPYEKAYDIAENNERELRNINQKNTKDVHIKLIKKYKDIEIWLVDGEVVRDEYDINFTEGGHDLVYDYIPYNEIWIDNSLIKSEIPVTILHEIYERELMSNGYSYDDAHDEALKLEQEQRQTSNSNL